MTTGSNLLSDQVFQLNTFLWSLEHLPEQGPVRPMLREAGYYLMAVGHRVLVSRDPSVIDVLKRLTGSPDRSACRPDLWLKHSDHRIQPVVELKGRSFSPDSTNSRQAFKLLISASDLSLSLAESKKRPGHVIYGTSSTDANDIEATLDQLAGRVRVEGVRPAPTAVIGLSLEEEGVAMSSPTPSDLPEPAAAALSKPEIVLRRHGDDDIRPLYFVPWIPGIKATQDPDLHNDGLRELTARVLTQAQGHIGRATVPVTVVMEGDHLLKGATFGIFDRWRESRDQFSRAAIKMVFKALHSRVEVRKEAKRLEIDLADVDEQDDAIKCLRETDPADPTTNLSTVFHEQLGLFDD